MDQESDGAGSGSGHRPSRTRGRGDPFLGVDIGGTKVALRVEDGTRHVTETAFTWAARHSAACDLDRLARHVREVRDRLGVSSFRAVGVAMPATVGPDGRVTAWPSRPEWTGTDLGASLRALFPEAAVAWADDGDLGALAEARLADCDDLLYLGVGTGVGGGLVLGGQPCPGLGRGSFEVGHMVVELRGPRCVCGRRGCLQAIASGPATLRRASGLRRGPVTFDTLRRGWHEQQPWAVSPVRRTCRALAAAAVSVHELLRPRLVRVGGGFATGLPGFVELVRDDLAGMSRPGVPPLPVEPAALGGLSSLRGAVHLARLVAGR